MGAGVRSDTGTVPLLSSGELYRRAHKIGELARIIMDCTASASTRSDPARAMRILHEIGAIAGKVSDE